MNSVSFQKITMSSSLIDFLLCGLTYVLLSYFLKLWITPPQQPSSGESRGGKPVGEGPVIDLPPGVTWPQREMAEVE